MCARRQTGFSLIELIVALVIAGGALAGMLQVYGQFVQSSNTPLMRKQALAVAESLLEEIQLMPFTICDPDDANVWAAAGAAACATPAEAIGPEVGETRTGTPRFDNVNDYDGWGLADYVDFTGAALPGYGAAVTVAAAALGTITAATGNALLITVTVIQPDGETVVLQGYRTRHSPNSP